MPSQNRLELTRALDQHDQRDASTLVARQFTAILTTSQVFPDLKDSALVDATAGAVNVTLPAGSDEIIGLPFYALKTDVSANAVGLVRAGSDTFAPGAGTSITTAVQGGEVGAVWDGTNWRALSGAGGAAAASSLTTTGALVVGTTATIGTGLTVTAGGVTITAGGALISAGNLVLTSGVRVVANLPSAANDAAAAALSPTVPVGGLYHTAGAVKQRLA